MIQKCKRCKKDFSSKYKSVYCNKCFGELFPPKKKMKMAKNFRIGKNERKILLKARRNVMDKPSQPSFWTGDHIDYIYPKEDFEKRIPKYSFDSLVKKGFLRPKRIYNDTAYHITKKGRRYVVDEM